MAHSPQECFLSLTRHCHSLVIKTLPLKKKKKSFNFIYVWLPWIFVAAWSELSPVGASMDHPLVAVLGLLIVAVPLVQSTSSKVCGLQELQHMGSVVVALGL